MFKRVISVGELIRWEALGHYPVELQDKYINWKTRMIKNQDVQCQRFYFYFINFDFRVGFHPRV